MRDHGRDSGHRGPGLDHPYLLDFVPHPGEVEVIAIDPRYDYSKHGYWVIHKETRRKGRVGYYDKEEKTVWVVWPPYKRKSSSSGHSPDELSWVKRDPEPWYDMEAIARRQGGG